MELQVYDQNFIQIAVIRSFTSLIWVKRYKECGDFEIEIAFDSDLGIPNWMKRDNYVSLDIDNQDGYYMIIETIETAIDSENKKSIKASGKSLENILNRRIVWEQIAYTNRKTIDIVQDLLNKSIISPTLTARKIDNFVFRYPEITDDFSMINAEYTGDSILDSIRGLANLDNYGVSVLYDEESNLFVCNLYKGDDRSWDQSRFNPILFSSDMNTLLSSDYLQSTAEYKNVILAMGQGQGSSRTRYILGEVSGLDRREYYKDARDVSTSNALKQRAEEAMREYRVKELLDGEVTADRYVYGVDYFIGDIVQIKNELGIERKARITEMIFSQDSSGISLYPTVEIIEEEG